MPKGIEIYTHCRIRYQQTTFIDSYISVSLTLLPLPSRMCLTCFQFCCSFLETTLSLCLQKKPYLLLIWTASSTLELWSHKINFSLSLLFHRCHSFFHFHISFYIHSNCGGCRHYWKYENVKLSSNETLIILLIHAVGWPRPLFEFLKSSGSSSIIVMVWWC